MKHTEKNSRNGWEHPKLVERRDKFVTTTTVDKDVSKEVFNTTPLFQTLKHGGTSTSDLPYDTISQTKASEIDFLQLENVLLDMTWIYVIESLSFKILPCFNIDECELTVFVKRRICKIFYSIK